MRVECRSRRLHRRNERGPYGQVETCEQDRACCYSGLEASVTEGETSQPGREEPQLPPGGEEEILPPNEMAAVQEARHNVEERQAEEDDPEVN